MRKLLLFLPLPFFCGCILSIAYDVRTARDWSNIKQNILVTRQAQPTFKSVWGAPTRTYSQSGNAEGFGAEWTGADGAKGHFALKGNRTYDIWFYEQKGVTLVFYNSQLAAWKWAKTPQFVGPDEK